MAVLDSYLFLFGGESPRGTCAKVYRLTVNTDVNKS
jgi:hypothetical protein